MNGLNIILTLVSLALYFLGMIAVLAGLKTLYGRRSRIPMLKLALWPILILAATIEEALRNGERNK